jgi:hypothetical protein
MIYCIFYCNLKDVTKWKIMKMQRSDGVLVAAKNKKEVQLFRFQHAVALGRTIQDQGIYDVQVKALSELYAPED